MTSEHGDAEFPTGLLRETAGWSVPVALAIAIAGSALAQDVRFGVSCLLGAALDVGTLRWALHRAGDAHSLTSLFLLRLFSKGALLMVAALLPQWMNLLGTAAGVLVVDLTLATAGSAAAAWHTFRPHRTGG